jgi:hypothetical protein
MKILIEKTTFIKLKLEVEDNACDESNFSHHYFMCQLFMWSDNSREMIFRNLKEGILKISWNLRTRLILIRIVMLIYSKNMSLERSYHINLASKLFSKKYGSLKGGNYFIAIKIFALYLIRQIEYGT